MAFTTGAKNDAVNATVTGYTWISLHTGDPGTTGASEASGGSYARKQTTWPTSTAGVSLGSKVSFTNLIAAGYTHYGVWSAASGGTFRFGNPLSPGVTLNGPGGIDVTPKCEFP
ncbi:head protein [Mycobacterium phage Bromden]|uniref:Minor tail protein n=1 Tax=Mycobacterium phage Bromden TaxID=2283252 RepID=A0A345MBF9_9CAUD|nr:head protein [Mycobacterium phage Bromden]AXH67830.1 hypothetical protein SEA_BROMDEN_24 [Mycobacterium phage Bromden]